MTFKPEIGKRHVQRDGEITEVINLHERSGMLYVGKSIGNSRMSWTSTGVYNRDTPSDFDLVAVYEELQYYWMNVYPAGRPCVYETEESALRYCVNNVKPIKLQVVKDGE